MAGETSLNDQLNTADVIWNLTDLYSGTDGGDVNIDIQWLKKECTDISEKFKGKISSLSPAELHSLVNRIETLQTILGKLATYGFLNFTTQVDNEEAGAFYQKIRELISDIEKELVFFDIEWNLLEDDKANQILLDSNFDHYSHHLKTLRRYRPHQLSEDSERLLIERKIVGRSSWTTLFEKIFCNLKFGKDERTEEEVLTDLYHKESSIRKQAAKDMTAGLANQNYILTHIFNTLAAEKMVTDRQRNYSSWVSSMNLNNQVADSTVETLVEAVKNRYDVVSRYYTIKKEILQVDTLYDYDRYAPLPSLPTQQVNWETCKTVVLDAFNKFSPEIAEIAAQFFDKNYIHAPVIKGKRGGAFAHPCVPEVHPYIMVNYTGSLRDVSTVAHELGHGVHQVLASEKGYFYSDTPLVLAETASVFAELLVFRSQVDMLDNPAQRRAFICQKLESIFATVFRQTAMNRFEHGMHEARREQGELTSDQLSDIWIQTQQEMFGDSVILTEDYRIWWSYIPHFLNSPGYVYSYAFGELLALYGIYEQEGAGFVDKYATLLKAGGSASPYDLLQPFGINLDDKQFWNTGLALIDKLLDEIE